MCFIFICDELDDLSCELLLQPPKPKTRNIFYNVSYNEQIINLVPAKIIVNIFNIYISYNEQIINPLSGIKLHK